MDNIFFYIESVIEKNPKNPGSFLLPLKNKKKEQLIRLYNIMSIERPTKLEIEGQRLSKLNWNQWIYIDEKGGNLPMGELFEEKNDFEKPEERRHELENQIEVMKSELIRAQKYLNRLEQFEAEKLRLREDLESKIEQFNMLAEDYQHEKESYLQVLEHVQDQVNLYREQSGKFEDEKGSWSKQIDDLKAELSQTKIMLMEMKEIEKKNEMLVTELQAKEMEIYKMKRDHEREVEQQMEKYKLELQKYQERISQYERDRGLWEKQMRQMKAQFVGLESNLEEREKFIQQYIINRPHSQMTSEISAEAQIYQTMSKPEQEELLQTQRMPQHSQQPSDWFMRVLSQQQDQYSSVPKPRKEKGSHAPTMDFFTQRDKSNQPSITGSVYGSQWDEESF